MYRSRRPILFTGVKETLDPYCPTRSQFSLCRPQEDPSSKERVFGRGVSYFADDELEECLLPVLMRIPLLPPWAVPAPVQQCGQRDLGLALRPSLMISCVRPRSGVGSWKAVTFHPIRPRDLPIWDLANCGFVDRLTPNDYPVAHPGETDLTYYGMMMGGLPNTAEKKMAALSILSKLSNESIGLVGVHLYEDGFIQPHSGGHLTFFYVQGMTAAANVAKWSKYLLVCEDEIVVVLNSEGEPEQAEKILRTIIPAHADGTPFHKMGHPCPIEYKENAPKRRAPRPILP